ncbi:MAG: hypothetical protein QXT28_11615 [Thermofilaceae archaeon]
MLGNPLPGFEPPLPLELQVTPELVSAAYKRALRLGLYWRLKPEERAILALARRLRAIKSPLLVEIILKILSKVWPEKARLHEAFKLGLQVVARRIQAALRVGAQRIADFYAKLTPKAILQLGLAAMNLPPLYR